MHPCIAQYVHGCYLMEKVLKDSCPNLGSLTWSQKDIICAKCRRIEEGFICKESHSRIEIREMKCDCESNECCEELNCCCRDYKWNALWIIPLVFVSITLVWHSGRWALIPGIILGLGSLFIMQARVLMLLQFHARHAQ